MQYQLRLYSIRPGAMADFLEAWLTGVYPLRRQSGFTFVGAWVVERSDRFVWILGYDGPEGFESADRAYYASVDRAALDPDPAQYIERAEHFPIVSVLPEVTP